MKHIDSDLLERQKEDPESFDFEDIYRKLEKLKIEHQIDDDSFHMIEVQLCELDNYFQDLQESKDTKITRKVFYYTENLINKWFSVRSTEKKQEYIMALANNLAMLKSEVIYESNPSRKLLENIEVLSKNVSNPYKDVYIRPISSLLPSNEHKISRFKLKGQEESGITIPSLTFKPKYYWDVEIEFRGESLSLSEISEFLLIFSNSIENTEGCAISIDEVENGSIRFKLKVWFRDLKSKEETKQILDLGKRAAVGYVEKAASENDQVKKVTEKTQAEIDLLKKQHDSIPDDVLQERELLVNEKMKAEIEKIKIENAKHKIEVISMLSDLLASSLLKQNNIRIAINDNVYFAKDENKISIGETIIVIDKGTKKLYK